QIWVDERIARRVLKKFDIEFMGKQMFKGFASEQKVHLLRGYRQNAEVIYQGELVGREEELARLANFAGPLWQNRFAGLCLVSGDAGIGKGRLVHEFHLSELFERNNALWVVCQSNQILRQSFNPLRGWLLRYFGLLPGQSNEEQKQAFDSKLDDLLGSIPDLELARELDRTRSLLAALVDLSWPESLYEQLDAEGRHNNTLLALIALLKAESLRQPVILFLEDLQFIDNDTRDFLPRLKRAILAAGGGYPLAMIVTSRPYGISLAADWIDEQIDLPGLSHAALARLIETLLGGVAAAELVSFVMDRSEGNPYFAEQIIRYLQDEKLIEMSQAGWALVRKLGDVFLPRDIGAVLVARLDQLAREVRESIQTASVLGREFEIQILLQMLREEENVHRCVAEAEKAAIWAPLNEMRYIFSHGLLRDAAYAMQMQSRRLELHALALEALERLYADKIKQYYPELAYHAEHAQFREKAQQYYTLAGKACSDLYQNGQGIDYYTRALAFTSVDDLRTLFDLLAERMELFNRLGDRVSQSQDLDSLEALAGQLNDAQCMAQVDVLFAHYFISIGDYPAVVRHSENVMELNRTVEDADIALDTYRVWPLALLRQGKLEEAMRVAQEGRRLAQVYGVPVKEGYILNSMGLIAIEQKDPAIAHGYLEKALSIAKETGDRRLESRSLANLGYSAGLIRQDYPSAREYFEEGYAIMHEHGERAAECTALGNLGWVAGMQGDFLAARWYLEQALLAAREVGNLYLETNSLINLSAITGAGNEAQSSLAYAQNALTLSSKTGDRAGEAWSLLYMGYACLLLNELEQAEESFRQSIAIREELGQPGPRTEPVAGLIQTLLLKGESTAAMSETEKIISYLEAGGTLEGTEEPLRVYYACHLALENAQDPRSHTVLATAVQLLEAQVSKLRDEGSRQMYVENVPWRLAIQQVWRELNN
ncbi:MAG: ATP-binding protein, partial [Anaerolineales bacterium]